jgi:hypothetical protein
MACTTSAQTTIVFKISALYLLRATEKSTQQISVNGGGGGNAA